jgi:hypothetical protein
VGSLGISNPSINRNKPKSTELPYSGSFQCKRRRVAHFSSVNKVRVPHFSPVNKLRVSYFSLVFGRSGILTNDVPSATRVLIFRIDFFGPTYLSWSHFSQNRREVGHPHCVFVIGDKHGLIFGTTTSVTPVHAGIAAYSNCLRRDCGVTQA